MTSALPTSVELYLVRHAVAADRGPEFPDDDLRPLTAEGDERWRRAVAGLREFGVRLDVVLSSPLVRAVQTAERLSTGLRPHPRMLVVDALAPGGTTADIVAAVAAAAGAGRGASRLALVGHEPDLGELAATLIGARRALEFKKGGVCRIDLTRAAPTGPGVLRWFLPPRVLRGLAT